MEKGFSVLRRLDRGWITASHYRPPLIVASICFTVQAWSILDSDIGIWPEARWFWPAAELAAAVVCLVAALKITRPSRYIAACTIVAVELLRASAIFAEFGADVSHIIARHVLVAFLAAYLLLDD